MPDDREELAERFTRDEEVDRAVKEAVEHALEHHEKKGNPVAIWRDGRIVSVDPDTGKERNAGD